MKISLAHKRFNLRNCHERTCLTALRYAYVLVSCASMIFALSLSGCATARSVEVRRASESVVRHIYDKDNRPDEQVAEHPSVEANTHWEFEFVPEFSVERIKLQFSENKYTSVVCVKRVAIDLNLPIQVWLPESASPRVIAHENGHVEICRHFYLDAEKQARLAAEGILNCQFSGTADSEKESMNKALESASSALVAPFRDSIILPANRAGAIYDRLTRHGQSDLSVENAVKRAIAEAK